MEEYREAAENGDPEAAEMMAYHMAKRGYSSREEVVALLKAASDAGRQSASWKLADYYANWDSTEYHEKIEHYCRIAFAGGRVYTHKDPECIYGSIQYWIEKHHPEWCEKEEGFLDDGRYYLCATGRYGLHVFCGIGEEAAREKTGIKPPEDEKTVAQYPYSYPFLHEEPIGFREYEQGIWIPATPEETSAWIIIRRSIREGDAFGPWSLAAGFEQSLIRCADGGYSYAWYLLGWYFHERPPVFDRGYTGEDKNFYKKAETYYQKAIDAGIPEGCYGLGYLRLFGLCRHGDACDEAYTPQDPVESVEWILKAARGGVREAARGLARLFRNDIYHPGYAERAGELGLFSLEAMAEDEVARYFAWLGEADSAGAEPGDITRRIQQALDNLRKQLGDPHQ